MAAALLGAGDCKSEESMLVDKECFAAAFVLLVGHVWFEVDDVGELTGSAKISFGIAFLPVLSNVVSSCHREINYIALVDALNCSLNLDLFHSKFCLFNKRLYPDTKVICIKILYIYICMYVIYIYSNNIITPKN